MFNHFEREALIWKAQVSANEKLLLLALNSFVDAEGECFPGQKRLSNMTGIGSRTVTEIIKRLGERGIISKQSRYIQLRRTSNRYKVHFENLSAISALSTNALSADIAPEVSAADAPEVSAADAHELSSNNCPELSTQTFVGNEQKNLFEAEQELVEPELKISDQLEVLKQEYNTLKADAWIRADKITPERERLLKQFIKFTSSSFEEALDNFRFVIKQASTDPWWAPKRIALENILTKSKYQKFLEQASQQKSIPGTLEKPDQEFKEYVNENGYIITARGHRLPHNPHAEIFAPPPSTPYTAPQTSGTGPSPAEVKRRMDQLQRIMGSK